jgi:hypothetical protein
MHPATTLCLSTSLLLVSVDRALAFNFGFVRVPDWMDVWIVALLAATCVAWLGLALTKPRGVAFNQLPNVRISPLANVFRYSLLIAFSGMMIMVFLGMGLRRYAEF